MKKSQREPTSEWRKTKYANLIRFVASGTLFARFKAGGKLIRRSLDTSDLAVGKRKLDEMTSAERESKTDIRDGKLTFTTALEEYRARGYRIAVTGCTARKRKPIKDRTRAYYEERIRALLKSWPGLESLSLRKIAQKDCETWANKFEQVSSGSAFNHTISILRQVIQIGVENGARYDNPALSLGRVGEKPKKMQLPSRDQFDQFVTEVENSGSGWSTPCANLIRFLAFGGMRKSEAANVTWADVDFEGGKIIVWGDPLNRTKNGEFRSVPMISEMQQLLESIRAEDPTAPATDRVMGVAECQKAMNGAAARVKMARITHHDLRHLFATRCIESGVDIPTVSRWLGHKDGGALAMRVYGHLRDEHSTQMAQKVTFAKPTNITPAVALEKSVAKVQAA